MGDEGMGESMWGVSEYMCGVVAGKLQERGARDVAGQWK